MDDQCFNCDGPAARRCTLVLDAGPDLEAKPICEACFAFFSDAETLEVRVDAREVDATEPAGGA